MQSTKLRKIAAAAIAVMLVVCMGAGVLLQYGTGFLWKNEEEKQDALLTAETTQVVSDEAMQVVSESAQEYFARPTGGKETYNILEIVPNETYRTIGNLIGGKEPYPEVLEKLANGQGSTNANVMGAAGTYTTPFQVVVNGNKREYLDEYPTSGSVIGDKNMGKWGILKEKVGSAGDSGPAGHFEYVGNNNGLYTLDTSSIEITTVAQAGGSYMGNFTMGDLYNRNAVSELGLTANSEENGVTDYNYDAILTYDNSKNKGYYVKSVVFNNETGEYVIDHVETKKLLVGESGTSSEYESALQSALLTANYNRIVFKEYSVTDGAGDISSGDISSGDISSGDISSGDISSGDAGAGIWMNKRYKLEFDYTTSNISDCKVYYVVSEYVFNPEGGQFLAKLTRGSNGEYYRLKTSGEDGEYERLITHFTMIAQDANYWAQPDRNWVWVEGAAPGGKEYSTLAEYDNGKGVLWTPSFACDNNGYKSYYVRNTYKNNEWFKIICLGATGYKGTGDVSSYLSGGNLPTGQSLASALATFDKSNTIQIISKEPGQVTAADIENADLIYISNGYMFDSWSSNLGSLGGVDTNLLGKAYGSDLESFPLAVQIYKSCMTKSKAVMFSANLDGMQSTCPNLYGLSILFTTFKNPHTMEYFLPSMRSAAERIGLQQFDEATGKIELRYAKNIWYAPGQDSSAGYPEVVVSEDENGNREYNTLSTYTWTSSCFYVKDYDRDTIFRPGFELTENTYTYINDVYERYFIFHWDSAGFWQTLSNMTKIYEILKRDIFDLSITNAAMNTNWQDVIYVDEFDTKYNIFYNIVGRGVLSDENPTVERVEVYQFKDTDNDGLLDADAKPVMEIRASNSITRNPDITDSAKSIIDSNGTLLDASGQLAYSHPGSVYAGYPIDVKAFFSGSSEREMSFVIKAIGKQKVAEGRYETVTDSAAVTVIIRDMFELN